MLIESNKIEELSLSQQIELLEKVSAALAKHGQENNVPEWHKDILTAREVSTDKSNQWLTLAEVKSNFRR